jgi:hypothetical protein
LLRFPVVPFARRRCAGVAVLDVLIIAVAALLALLVIAVAILAGLRDERFAENRWPYAIGSASGSLVIPAVVAIIAFFVARRSRRAAGIAASIALALVLVSTLASIGAKARARASPDEAMSRELAAQANALREEQRAEFERTGTVGSSDRLDRLIETMVKSGQKAGTTQGRAVELSAAVLKEFGDRVKAYEAKVVEVRALGGVDGDSINSVADVDTRILKWREVGRLAADLTKRTRALPDQIRSRLAGSGLSQAEIDEFMAGMLAGGRINLLIEVRTQEEAIIRAIIDQLTVLRHAYGDWEYHPRQKAVVFEREDDLAKFNAAAERGQAAGAAQTAAQQKLLNLR